jgi:beta-N-acetylhexosaminidase
MVAALLAGDIVPDLLNGGTGVWEHSVECMLERMTVRQKIGQCIVVGWSGSTLTQDIREAVVQHHCGGIRLSPFTRLFRYFSDHRLGTPEHNNEHPREKHRVQGIPPWVSPERYAGQLAELRRLSVDHGAQVPIHFVIDQEGDTSKDISRGGIAQFPSALGLAASGDPELTYRASRAVARQVRDSGITVVHSPVLDVNTNPRNPEIGRRAFGDDPEVVAEHGRAVVRGFRDAGVLAVAKHFPGRGDSAVDAHHDCPVLDVPLSRLRQVDLLPYRRLIDSGLEAVMIAHCVYPALDDQIATVSRPIVTGLLREEMGFDGLVTTDSLTMGALIDAYGVGEAAVLALRAGIDIILMKAENRWRSALFEAVERALDDGRLREEEIDVKVRRLLAWKHRSGLLSVPAFDPAKAADSYRLPEIRSIERETAEHAAVIVKGARFFPLDCSLRTALVYQENSVKSPNDQWDYPSLFGDLMETAWPDIHTFEVPFSGDAPAEDAVAFVRSGRFKQVIVTSFYDRSGPPSTVAREVLSAGLPTILVTNTPYTICGRGGLLTDASAILLNLNVTPEGLRVTRDIIMGTSTPRGRWPLSAYHPLKQTKEVAT